MMGYIKNVVVFSSLSSNDFLRIYYPLNRRDRSNRESNEQELDANRRQIPPSKPKWEITKITNRQDTTKTKWLTEWAAISQKVVAQQPKPN